MGATFTTPEEAQAAADLLAWAESIGLEFQWADDWSVDHGREFDCYEDGGPETCEYCQAVTADGTVLASLHCIDDATDEYRQVIEVELAGEAQWELDQLVRRALTGQA